MGIAEYAERPSEELQSTQSAPDRDLFRMVWDLLANPWLLILVAGIDLLLVGAATFLPQLPGQFIDSPAEANRWLLATAGEYGTLGALLRGLGLFDVLHSFALRVGMALLGLLLFVQLGDLLAQWLRLRRLPELLEAPVAEPGQPIDVPGHLPVHGLRVAVDAPPPAVAPRVATTLADLSPSQPPFTATTPLPGDVPAAEQRWLILGHAWAAALRPLLLAGILLAVGVLWIGANFGWEVTPPTLAPGSEFRFPRRDIVLRYQAPENEEPGLVPELYVEVGSESGVLAVKERGKLRLGQVTVSAEAGPLGLLLMTPDKRPALALPGETEGQAQLGFLFPGPGSEETVLLPQAGAGLRLVRVDDPQGNSGERTTFLIEVFHQESNEPILRETLDRLGQEGRELRAIPLPDGEMPLVFQLAPGLDVQVRHLPGDWLLWPALILGLVGAAGFLRRPFFLLVQLAPWPVERSVLVGQSDRPALLRRLEAVGPGEIQPDGSPDPSEE